MMVVHFFRPPCSVCN